MHSFLITRIVVKGDLLTAIICRLVLLAAICLINLAYILKETAPSPVGELVDRPDGQAEEWLQTEWINSLSSSSWCFDFS